MTRSASARPTAATRSSVKPAAQPKAAARAVARPASAKASAKSASARSASASSSSVKAASVKASSAAKPGAAGTRATARPLAAKTASRTSARRAGRLVLVVGASGVGKDSVIEFARRRLPDDADVRFARRVITRPIDMGAEQHLPVSPSQFAAMRDEGRFAVSWEAHGFHYGIGDEVRGWLAQGATVVLSGSRHHVAETLAAFPNLELVHVVAAPAVRRTRLTQRSRESEAMIESRLVRGTDWAPPAGLPVLELNNDGLLALAGEALRDVLVKGFAAWTPALTVRTSCAPRARSATPPRAPSPRQGRRTTAAAS